MFLPTCLAAAEKATPLIDLDGTVFVQFGLFLLTMAVLYVLLFRPYLKVRDAREHHIDGARDEAKSMAERSATMEREVEAQIVKARQRGIEERNGLRAEGVAHEQRVLAEARAVAQKEIDGGRASAARDREAARAALLAESGAIGRKVAARILGREV